MNKNHGGSRTGSGRKKTFKEPVLINFKCEAADKAKAKEKHGNKLNKLFNEWLKAITQTL